MDVSFNQEIFIEHILGTLLVEDRAMNKIEKFLFSKIYIQVGIR